MEVECEFIDEEWTYDNAERVLYTCNITEVSIIEPETEITNFIGEHLPGRSSKSVTAIRFDLTTVHYFPRGLGQIFPNLKSLQIYECRLKEISREDLVGLENLEDFCMNRNNLRSLPSDLFVGFLKLKEVSFQGNELEYLSSKLFKPIAGNGLTYASFDENIKINVYFEPERPGTLNSLQELMNIIDEKCEPPKEKFKNIFAIGLNKLWSSKIYADFTIICGAGEQKEAKEFEVHKCVLATQSSVLAAVFNHDMKEKQTGKMAIEDFSEDVVEAMLESMYTGEVQEMNTMELYAIADKYGVQLLKEITEKIILRNIDGSNSIEVLGFAHLHNSTVLKRAAFNKIKEMFTDVDLDEKLMNETNNLQKLIKAHRKNLKAQAEFHQALKKFKKAD